MQQKREIQVRLYNKESNTYSLLRTIRRVPWLEQIGNFNPMFCRYNGVRTLVHSDEGDLSDPFRRDGSYMDSLYIKEEDDNARSRRV